MQRLNEVTKDKILSLELSSQVQISIPANSILLSFSLFSIQTGHKRFPFKVVVGLFCILGWISLVVLRPYDSGLRESRLA